MIAHIISGLGTGGAETMLFKLISATNMSKSMIICLGEKSDTDISQKLLNAGAKIYWLNVTKKSLGIPAILTLKKILRAEQPVILQGWMYHGNLAALMSACFLDKPVISWGIRHSLHDVKQNKRLTRFIIKLGAKLSRWADVVIYNSMASKIQHEKIGYASKKSEVIPNGFNLNAMCPDKGKRCVMRHTLNATESEILVGCVARYHPVKGHAVLLNAAKHLGGQFNHVRFVLVGLGCDESNLNLTSDIGVLGLQDSFTLLGERQDIAGLINAFDIVVSPSLSEAFSNTIGEAMACGVPCVVTDVGDSAWLLGDGGISVPANDPFKLAEAICQLASQSGASRAALGLKARARMSAHFSMSEVAEKYNKLYKQTLLNKRLH